MNLFYDTETTGFVNKKMALDAVEQPRVVQLGAILDFEDGREAMRLDVIINHPFDALPANVRAGWVGEDGISGAAKIHGISPAISEQIGVTESIAIELFCDMLAVAKTVVGHNITGFDNTLMTGVIRRVLRRPDADPFAGKRILDTMVAGKPLAAMPSRQGGYKNPKLTELHQKLFGEGFEDAHQAISDVLACRRCFYEMMRIVEARKAA